MYSTLELHKLRFYIIMFMQLDSKFYIHDKVPWLSALYNENIG